MATLIESFGDKGTEAIFHGGPERLIRRYPPSVVTAVIQKLDVINAARSLQDLLAPPGNRLEALKGSMKGLHSIRVNDQWRLAFRWDGTNAHEVLLADYH